MPLGRHTPGEQESQGADCLLLGYGLLVGISPVVGESLWTHGYATHHGFPITFGTSAGFMILVGVVLFVRFLRENRVLKEGVPSEEA